MQVTAKPREPSAEPAPPGDDLHAQDSPGRASSPDEVAVWHGPSARARRWSAAPRRITDGWAAGAARLLPSSNLASVIGRP
jgi:hypothetical protein